MKEDRRLRSFFLISLALIVSLLLTAVFANSGTAYSTHESSTNYKQGLNTSPLLHQRLEIAGPVENNPAPFLVQELDPPESCGLPQSGPFGDDVEFLLGPTSDGPAGLRLDQIPAWKGAQGIIDYPWTATSKGDVAAAAMSTEQIVAVWVEDNSWWTQFRSRIWQSSSGWGGYVDLGQLPDGNPAVISRHGDHWEVYARQGGSIKYKVYEFENLSPSWLTVPGVTGAASDPVVVSSSANHTALFYRDAEGAAWFTEWYGGIGWRKDPIRLSDAQHQLFLPLVSSPGITGSSQPGIFSGFSSQVPDKYNPDFGSQLSAFSRAENHLAVVGVDLDGQLWVKERSAHHATDWHDTLWVRLMEGAAIEKPAIGSRHSNHLAVAVRDSTGAPHYIEWTQGSGWKAPVSLGGEFSSPLTLAATSVDAQSLYGVSQTGSVIERVWTEDGGWGGAQVLVGGVATDQTLAAVTRRVNDVMMLGHYSSLNHFFYNHYSSQGESFSKSTFLAAGQEAYPRGQALIRLDDQVYWVAANQSEDDPAHWQVEMVDLHYLTRVANLTLAEHDVGEDENSASLITGDFDLDGNEEAVVATSKIQEVDDVSLSLSLLEFAFSPSPTISSTTVFSQSCQKAGTELPYVSLAAGDLDGDGVQNEIVFVETSDCVSAGIHIRVYHYSSSTNTLELWHEADFPFTNPGGSQEVEVAIGRLQGCSDNREQVVVIEGAKDGNYPNFTVRDNVKRFCWNENDPNKLVEIANNYASKTPDLTFSSPFGQNLAVDSGDLDGDGFEEAAYFYGNVVVVLDPDNIPEKWVRLEQIQDPACSTGYEDSSLAVGDLDWDGRAEIAHTIECGDWNVGYTQVSSLFEILDGGKLVLTAQTASSDVGRAQVLVGDLDSDSFVSELIGCANITDVSVASVVNGAPRHYVDGAPVQSSGVRFAQGEGYGGGQEYSTMMSFGSSFSIGFEQEISIPIIGTKIGEIRSSVTQDFMWSTGQSSSREEMVTEESGYENEGSDLMGAVCYHGTNYKCAFYEVYAPDAPDKRSTAMVCKPLGMPYRECKSLDYWYSEQFKQAAGGSWAPLGHCSEDGACTNDVTTYPSGLPIDEYMLMFSRADTNPIRISYDPNPGTDYWSVTQMQGGAQASLRSFESNTTVSAGATTFGVTVDTGFTKGYGSEESRSVNWEETLEIGMGVEEFRDPELPCYDIVPYLYHARATTAAGATYPYLELDYYVPCIDCCS